VSFSGTKGVRTRNARDRCHLTFMRQKNNKKLAGKKSLWEVN